jgi:hypothetical protein
MVSVIRDGDGVNNADDGGNGGDGRNDAVSQGSCLSDQEMPVSGFI